MTRQKQKYSTGTLFAELSKKVQKTKNNEGGNDNGSKSKGTRK